MITRYKIQISGIVQGVGFRPFVKNLALKYNINGFVKNDSSGVEIEAQAKSQILDEFVSEIRKNPPPLAKIVDFCITQIALQNDKDFNIIVSDGTKTKTTFVSPDVKICKDCIEDINDKKSRFYGYFATNCTNCGPRYTIISTLPYDRGNTSMSEFEMCDECKKEYNDSSNRRFHAQPISCPNCGPKLSLYDKNKNIIDSKNPIEQTATLIKEGKIVAIKGLGGFHIVCDSTNEAVINRLRSAKNRPSKPYALMCKDISQIKKIAFITPKEEEVLTSIQAPIVILNKKENSFISDLVAPYIDKIGCMLPYTPLQVLLFEYLKLPIIATSANLKDEPIIINKDEIFEKLQFIEYVLDFNRDIINGIDDSVVQVVDNYLQVLRLARGYTPYSHKLPYKTDKKILAVGANQKNTISLAFEDSLILSPHIGDLESIESLEYFERTIKTFKRFYNFAPDTIICDKHPNYETTKWAKEQNINLIQIQHHKAHLQSVKGEFGLGDEMVGFIFDGTGYGDDDTLWGGEVFVQNIRKYHFKPIKLLGGAKAIKEPRRIALSLLFEKLTLDEVSSLNIPFLKTFSESELKLLYHSYVGNINTPKSSSVGRLFDAVASFCDIVHISTYEGESGLLIEKYYDDTIKEHLEYSINDGIIEIDFVKYLQTKPNNKNIFCTLFINTLVDIIVKIATIHHKEVILSGGVFQNKVLLTQCIKKLEEQNIKYHFGNKIPVNDGGISFGQAYYKLSL